MSDFEAATAIRPSGDGDVYAADIPDRWQQGRGAFGGVVIGILTRAILASERDRGRVLRSLSADLCAPAIPGAVEVRARSLRRGANVSFIDAQMLRDGALVARASAALASARALPA